MNTIERYEPNIYGDTGVQMDGMPHGDWVRYSDHAAEVERLKEGGKHTITPALIIDYGKVQAENAALKEEVQCNKDERADLVKLLDCHPAFLRHEIIRMQDQVRELPSIDRHREIQSDLTTARARIEELEGVLSDVAIWAECTMTSDESNRATDEAFDQIRERALQALSRTSEEGE